MSADGRLRLESATGLNGGGGVRVDGFDLVLTAVFLVTPALSFEASGRTAAALPLPVSEAVFCFSVTAVGPV